MDVTLPSNQQVELAVIGCMMLDPDRVIPLAQQWPITGESFSHGALNKLAAAMLEMYGEGRIIDMLTLPDYMKTFDDLNKSTNYAALLKQAVDSTPTSSQAEYYLELLKQYDLRCNVIRVSKDLIHRAMDSDDGERLVLEAPQRFSDLMKRVDKQATDAELLDEIHAEWSESKRRRDAGEDDVFIGLPTPFEKLNSVLCGLIPGLIIISGRPSQGKTTLEDNLMTYLAESGYPVGRVTMDMTKKRLLARALCRKAGVSMAKLRFGFAGASQLAQVDEAKGLLTKYPWHFLAQRNNLKVIMSWIRSMVVHEGCRAISIDYIQQIMTGDSRKDNDENGRIGYVSSSLKALSLELNVPILAVSQLSRAGETQDRNPKLSDLRGSGTLEQDATAVIMVYQDKDTPRQNNKRPTWVDVLKQQDGETLPIEFWLYEKYFRFEEAEENFGVVPDEDSGSRKKKGRR